MCHYLRNSSKAVHFLFMVEINSCCIDPNVTFKEENNELIHLCQNQREPTWVCQVEDGKLETLESFPEFEDGYSDDLYFNLEDARALHSEPYLLRKHELDLRSIRRSILKTKYEEQKRKWHDIHEHEHKHLDEDKHEDESIIDPAIRGVGWLIDPKYQNKGYATEAAKAMIDFMFKECKIKKIITGAAIGNPASWKVMEKLGFKRQEETKMVQYTFLDKETEIYLYLLEI